MLSIRFHLGDEMGHAIACVADILTKKGQPFIWSTILSDMCITTILFKWQHAVGKIISYSIYIIGLKFKIATFHGFSFMSIRGGGLSQDYARRQA